MKQIYILLIALLMGLSANAEESGTCGANLKWHLTDDGVLTISGEGEMTDYSYLNRSPWYDGQNIKRIIIDDSVTTIGDEAFNECSALTSVTIPNSVRAIGNDAFRGCSALTSVTIPNSVTTIGKSAFSDCSALTSVTIPNSVTTIGKNAFSYCRALTSVTIPNSVTTIADDTFSDCSSLTSVTIPNSVTTIGKNAFRYCLALTSVTIPNSVTTIGESAFTNNSAKIIWLTNTPPAGYRKVEGGIHYVVNDLYTDLSNKKVYPYLSSIFEVNGIKYVPVSPSERTCDAIDCTYTGDELKINKKVNYKGVDMTVREINPYTAYSANIKKVYIENGFTTIGKYAFSYCSHLTYVTIPNSVTTIGDRAFSHCSHLTSVTIPNSVTTIGDGAFSGCTNLQKVNIGNSVKTIEIYAFKNCTSITQISSEAVVPPTCEIFVFDGINKSKCKLIVPKNSLDAYKQAYQWKDFSLIEGSTTGITNTVYNKAGLADVYTIDGTKRLSKASTDEINALPKGVYIVNGKKIIIK